MSLTTASTIAIPTCSRRSVNVISDFDFIASSHRLDRRPLARLSNRRLWEIASNTSVSAISECRPSYWLTLAACVCGDISRVTRAAATRLGSTCLAACTHLTQNVCVRSAPPVKSEPMATSFSTRHLEHTTCQNSHNRLDKHRGNQSALLAGAHLITDTTGRGLA